MGNAVPRAEIAADLQICETAMRIRLKNMKLQAERILASGWRQKKFLR